MATLDGGEELAGTPHWAGALLSRLLLGILVWAGFMIPASWVAFEAGRRWYPAAVPFMELVVVGFLIMLFTRPLRGDDVEQIAGRIQSVVEEGPAVIVGYTGFVVVLLVAAASFEVAVVGSIAFLVATNSSYGPAAVVLAVVWPPIDSRLGRLTGVNVATVGILIGTVVNLVLASVYRVPRTVALDASAAVRASFAGG